MISIVHKLFEIYNLTKIKCDDLELYCKGDQTSYWLLVNKSPEVNAELQSKWLSSCVENTQDPALSKNISLLYLWEVQELSNEVLEKVRLVEEDKYFFKKHVLPYTVLEQDNLIDKIGEEKLINEFSYILNDRDIFEGYKSNLAIGGWESLLYRLAIKLPILSIGELSTVSLSDLEERISLSLESNPHANILRELDNVISKPAMSKDLSNDEVFDSLIQQLGRAGYQL